MIEILCAELTQGTQTVSENGIVSYHPPTSLALKAARILKILGDTNLTNNLLIQQLQFRVNEIMSENLILRANLNEHLLKKDEDERVRNSEQETSPLDSGTGGQSDLFGCDSSSQINNADQNSSTGSN